MTEKDKKAWLATRSKEEQLVLLVLITVAQQVMNMIPILGQLPAIDWLVIGVAAWKSWEAFKAGEARFWYPRWAIKIAGFISRFWNWITSWIPTDAGYRAWLKDRWLITLLAILAVTVVIEIPLNLFFFDQILLIADEIVLARVIWPIVLEIKNRIRNTALRVVGLDRKTRTP